MRSGGTSAAGTPPGASPPSRPGRRSASGTSPSTAETSASPSPRTIISASSSSVTVGAHPSDRIVVGSDTRRRYSGTNPVRTSTCSRQSSPTAAKQRSIQSPIECARPEPIAASKTASCKTSVNIARATSPANVHSFSTTRSPISSRSALPSRDPARGERDHHADVPRLAERALVVEEIADVGAHARALGSSARRRPMDPRDRVRARRVRTASRSEIGAPGVRELDAAPGDEDPRLGGVDAAPPRGRSARRSRWSRGSRTARRGGSSRRRRAGRRTRAGAPGRAPRPRRSARRRRGPARPAARRRSARRRSPCRPRAR